MTMYRVAEIFDSIIGEGFWTGTPATFIRLAGCAQACEFCDTDHRETMRLDAMQIADRAHYRVCVLTGGEPLEQEVGPLARTLQAYGHRVHLETNGTIALKYTFDWVCVSPKDLKRVEVKLADECKVVLGSVDTSLARELISADHYWIQPMSGKVDDAYRFVMNNDGWRLSVQVHKLIGVR